MKGRVRRYRRVGSLKSRMKSNLSPHTKNIGKQFLLKFKVLTFTKKAMKKVEEVVRDIILMDDVNEVEIYE